MLERDELRSVLLAVLVIASVGATALPVTAAVDSADRSTPGSVAAGGTATVTVTATMDGDGGAFSLTEEFGGNVAGASVRSVTVDGSDASPIIANANTDAAVVTLASTGPNAEVEVTYEVEATDANGEITIDGTVDGNSTIELGTDRITVGADNSPPTADAGSDRTATAGSTITLDGSDSSDPDGDSLSYTWRRVSGPAVTTQGSGGASTTAELRGTGTAVFELVVSDGVATDSDRVSVRIVEGNSTTTTTTTTTVTSTTESTTAASPTTSESVTSASTTSEPTTSEPTAESTASTTATMSSAPSSTTSTTAASATTTAADDGPGFTVVLALIALVAAGLLAVRRRED
jgi:PGF-CTERM protein